MGKTTVLVTGAGGRTGALIVKKMLREPYCRTHAVRVLVRSEQSKAALIETCSTDALDIHIGNILEPQSLTKPMEGAQKLVIVTSAKPQIVYSSLPWMAFSRFILGQKDQRPTFYYDENSSPEEIDWLGQKNQVDAAVKAGIDQVVLVGSMGGTQPGHFLNQMGNGNILLWKRKAEQYLIGSGVPYTIIHPGGLLPHFGDASKAPGGERELLVSVNDALLDSENRLIPREDVAEVCVQSLGSEGAIGRSFDLTSKPPGEGTVFTGLEGLLEKLGGENCSYDQPVLPASKL
jgi:uncharacterized protein YbjT (DUF2867 family)